MDHENDMSESTAEIKAAASVPSLSVRGLSKAYGNIRALEDVSLSFEVGEIHAIAGHNGAGKSTLVRILSGSEKPDRGTIVVNGDQIEISSPHMAHQMGIVTIHQELSLVPELTVAENIFLGDLYGRRELAINWPRLRTEAGRILAWLGFDVDVDLPVRMLSIARQQAVELAKALRRQARVILLDEPTATLPSPDVSRLIAVLRALSSRGITIIYISHRLEELYEFCERVSIFRDGRLIQTSSLSSTSSSEIVRAMIGRQLKTSLLETATSAAGERPRLGAGACGDVVFAVRNLADRGAVRDISMELRKGEVVGVAGLVGSGQSELASCLFGTALPAMGTIEVEGKEVRRMTPRLAVKLGIGLVPQDRKSHGFVRGMTLAHNLTLSSLGDFKRFLVLQLGREEQAAWGMIKRLNMRTARPDTQVEWLSGGNQQKVVFAKWLVRKTKILILEEPTRGIDVGSKEEIYELIKLFSEEGGTVLMFSSELVEVMMCDRVLVMASGRIVGEISHDRIDPHGDSVLELFQ